MVNGVRIRSAHYLQPGDRIRLGRHELELIREEPREEVLARPTREDPRPNTEIPAPYQAPESTPAPDVLSPREREVLELLALGHTQREIAERIGVGTKSVETYRARVAEKLGLRTRADLVRYALRYGLVEN
ncbi:MAG: hypothetical protein H6721_04715 [Sandaracinus sp.]|nr:hypothetical protein [Sandaracinus sp.]MCB9616341.1 hypothetical protein [Sandaracinus sp.]MCB9619251.1 hypothetical protein [Sandaracinus sp.]MCB9625132.1 hypothetical protein [Sandaracinus sp.]MCB9631429.1 hypothetical protein [Sandaracinus sp.]